MNSLPVDLGIWALLFTGVAFCGIGLFGLLIFPDTRSRTFTAFRATAIGLGAVVLAVITYGFYSLITVGGSQYLTLIIHTLFLIIVLAAGTWVILGVIRDRTAHEPACRSSPVSESAMKKED